MATHSSPRWPRLTERRALRALLYTILGVSGVLLLARYVVSIPGAVVPQTSEFDTLVRLVSHRMDLSMMVVVFTLSVVGLAASAKPDPPA